MILTSDKNVKYWYMLTSGMPGIEILEFALKHFRYDLQRNCIVRRSRISKLYYVFTTGSTFLSDYNTKTIEKTRERIKVEFKDVDSVT